MVSPTRRSWSPLLMLVICVILLLTPLARGVKEENFKKCDQSGFCKRNRAYADQAASHGSAWSSPYHLDSSSISLKDGSLTGTILRTLQSGTTVNFPLTVSFLESGAARVTIDEERRQKGDIELRHDSKARKERYDASELVLVGGLEKSKSATILSTEQAGVTRVKFGPDGKHEAVIKHSPFGVEFVRDGETQVIFNDRGLMNVEHWRAKIEIEKKEGEEAGEADAAVVDEESTWWEELFGGNTDSKPRGPESVALDISFPGYEHVFGLPEHTGPLSLKQTRGGEGNWDEPYRLYNLDVFEYIMDSPMALYGAIPLMHAHKKDSTVAVFWVNAAETWIDIVKSKSAVNTMSMGIAGSVDTQTHWFSESGLLDIFVILGPNPADIAKTYGELTGFTTMPQQFATAYHQCRWNYVTDEDVKDVDRKFDRANIPYDVIWLDIEYTDGKKYFTWDPLTFSNPVTMNEQLDTHDRKLVAIIDPHIKNEGGYEVVDQMKSKNLAVNDKTDSLYEGWCWPGSSHWIDAFNPAAITWWKGLFSYNFFKGTLPNVFIWNDMNEPSVFNGPETTMPKDNLHYNHFEHRDVHNLNGMTFHNATFQALLTRDAVAGTKPVPLRTKRPFVLTRAYFAGSQRYGAMWTGDNQADWPHLEASLPMLLAQNTAGFSFSGADVGGFFGNPSKELLTRWYQAGAFYPFFRGHAHIDTRRREPYLAGEPYTGIITQALRLRYSLLPAWYTAFHAASVSGAPILRPNWYVHPSDPAGFAIDDQMYLADTGLLVKPVTKEGGDSVDVYISDTATYYDYFDYTVYSPPSVSSGGRTHTIAAPLDKLPLLMQAGHIIPRRDRPRRSSGLMKWDPFTLVITLDPSNTTIYATGEIYLDDGESYEFTEGAYIHRRFVFTENTLTSEDAHAGTSAQAKSKEKYAKTMNAVSVEKIVVVGAPASWAGKKSVKVVMEGQGGAGREAGLLFHAAMEGKAAWAVVRRPDVGIGRGWRIEF